MSEEINIIEKEKGKANLSPVPYYLGRQYPFFIGNGGDLANRFYLYRIYSPGVDENSVPYISITKTAEKSDINTSNPGKDTDIISTIVWPKKISKFTEYLTEMMKKENATLVDAEKAYDFPRLLVPGNDNYLIRALIAGLRNNLRYSCYKFVEGRKVDILWDKDCFVLCTVRESETEIWLEPGKVYKNTDLLMKNPLDIEVTEDEIGIRLSKSQPKVISSLLYLVKALEKQSFDREL